MRHLKENNETGVVYTFYSYKGGVGRTMALANVAALLAKWGNKVLVVDWDLEAPGAEKFFAKTKLSGSRKNTPGILDLVKAKTDGIPLRWQDCLITAKLYDSSPPVSIITAGRDTPEYAETVQGLNWNELMPKHNMGAWLNDLREQWISEYDFVLIDSRTGISDIGGICTIILPDRIVLFFTTNEQSIDGVADVMHRARTAQSKLPVDRSRLLAVPVLARDEREEAPEQWKHWSDRITESMKEFYRDWLWKDVEPAEVIRKVYIPYVASWSFGERLPVFEMEEELKDPRTISVAYARLATLIHNKLDWKALDLQAGSHELSDARAEIDKAKAKIGEVQQHAERSKKRFLRYIIAIASVTLIAVIIATYLYFSWYIQNSKEQQLTRLWSADTPPQIRKRLLLSLYERGEISFRGIDLSKLDLAGVQLPEIDFQDANLGEIRFWKADLSGANLSGADLTGADLTGVDLTGADLVGANLSRAKLTEANLTDTDLSGTRLSRADLNEAVSTGADLTGAVIITNEFKNAQYMSKAKFHPQKFSFAVLVGDGTVHLIDGQTRKNELILRVPDEMINAFSFLYNGDSMVLGTKSGKLYQADLKTGERAFLKEFGKREIARLDAGRNDNIAVGLGGSIEDSKEGSSGFVYSLKAQRILSEYSAFFRDDFQGIAISHSGDVVAIQEVNGKPRGSCLFNASDGSEIKLCYHQKYGAGPLSVDVGPDDKTMATGYAPYHVIVWNTEDGSVKWLFEGHSNWVVSLDFSDNGRYLASGAGDSTARVYDLEDGQEIGLVRFPGISTYVKSVDISSDGSLLLTAIDGFVGIYEMPQKK